MPQQEDTKGFVRNEAALALFILSINDVQFLKDLKTDPDSTLWRHGFALSPEEREEVRKIFDDPHYEEISNLKDEEIIEKLTAPKPEEGLARTRRWPFW